MGLSLSRSNNNTALKLQAQSLTNFRGAYDDWPMWKSRTECAFNGSGYDKVLLHYARITCYEKLMDDEIMIYFKN